MKRIIILVSIFAVFSLIFSMPGCGSSSKSSRSGSGGGGGTGTGTGTGGTGTGTGPGGGGGLAWDEVSDTVKTATDPSEYFKAQDRPERCIQGDMYIIGSRSEMFDHVQAIRQNYSVHNRYDGPPWNGTSTDTNTWSITFALAQGLNDKAQAEAVRLAGGGSPKGSREGFQNYSRGEPVFMNGLDSSEFMISAKSDPATPVSDEGGFFPGEDYSSGDSGKWHVKGNGTMRVGFWYQTGTGSFNHKKYCGIGGAVAGNCVWWVIIVGE